MHHSHFSKLIDKICNNYFCTFYGKPFSGLSGRGGFSPMSQLNFTRIKELAGSYQPDMTQFLRDMIRLPSESCQEKAVVERIKTEMEKVGFDKVEIDPMGNVLGTIGNGQHMIAMDAHIDTVGVGNKDNWEFDPYEGYEDDEVIGGRGASDQEGGMASMVYAGKIIKDLELEGDYTLVVVGTVQEEDCDGLCWQYIIKESGVKPDFVISTEPTDGGIYRGQRGRMEIKVEVKGVSSHGSAPERGDNAIFKMGRILSELEALHGRLKTDDFLGKGSLTVSEIFYTSPSRCAVADGCTISIDRRLTAGEDKELALQQIRDLPAAKAANAQVSMYPYDRPSYTGLVYPTDCYFPAWVIPEDHTATQSAVATYKNLFDEEPRVDKWTFSTNGVAITGMFGIPCVGFGPGKESEAHAPNEKTWKADLVRCAAFYAALPLTYLGNRP
jgi:putative selenium metabolism hydrolase